MTQKLFLLPSALRFILNHPLNRGQKGKALLRYVRWQVSSRLAPGPVIIPFVNNARMIAQPGLMGATGILYTGLYEFEEMAFVLHALRDTDHFVDVGAHIGAFTVLAAAVIGASCTAIEPVPAAFNLLCENVKLNAAQAKVRCLNLGVSGQAGRLPFTAGLGAANRVATQADGQANVVEGAVQTLDEIAADYSPAMVKIDVEGYETEVIFGGERTLQQKGLFAVLMELRGHGKRYGFDEDALHQRMLGHGFQPYQYSPFPRELTALSGINRSTGTTIYIRDLQRASERIQSAPRFSVLDQSL
jgi:FkbM family methyltransferase